MNEISKIVRGHLRSRRTFVSRARLQQLVGITDAGDEQQRGKVWQLAAVLAQLWKDRIIGAELDYDTFRPSGMVYYSREVV